MSTKLAFCKFTLALSQGNKQNNNTETHFNEVLQYGHIHEEKVWFKQQRQDLLAQISSNFRFITIVTCDT